MTSKTTPFLIRLTAAAAAAGVSPLVLKKTIDDQLIPVSAVRVGKMMYVKRGEFQAWLGCRQQPSSELLAA